MTAMRALLAGAALAVASVAGAAEIEGAGPLVSTDWLEAAAGNEQVVILDIRGEDAYAAGHIPGAVHSDYGSGGWRVERDGVPGMLPEVPALEALIGGIGISNDDHVVVVPAGTGSSELGSATRVYWTFKVLGHDAVSILDGGYRTWAAEERPIDTVAATPAPAAFTADFRPELLATADDVRAAMDAGDAALIDARPVEQYLGLAQHPAARSPGTIPGAVNAPQEALVTIDGARMRDGQTLAYLMEQAGVDAGEKGIAFCNTGHWASIAWFANSEVLGRETSLYDGSMVEWTAGGDNPVVIETR